MKTRSTGVFDAASSPWAISGWCRWPSDAVRPEVVGGLGEQQSHLGFPAGARHPGFAVGDEVRGIHDSRLEQRQEAQLHRGRIAAWIADDASALDRGAIDFRQPVYRFSEEIRASMRHSVPLREYRRILEAEIRGEVDDPHAGGDELARLRHRDAVGGREEDDVALV